MKNPPDSCQNQVGNTKNLHDEVWDVNILKKSKTHKTIMTNAEKLAMKLVGALNEHVLQDPNSDYYIDLEKEDGTDFIHALANIMPAFIYNEIKEGGRVDQLAFNHVANQLCFQYCNLTD